MNIPSCPTYGLHGFLTHAAAYQQKRILDVLLQSWRRIHSMPPDSCLIMRRSQSIVFVCHHWRELALTSPLLWTAICLEDRVEFVDACLRRSAVAPLTIVSRCYIEDELALMKFIAPHIGRIRALDLRSLSTSAACTFILDAAR